MNFANRYEQMTGWVVSQCPNPDKFAHTYAGLAIWLAAAVLLRRSLRSIAPLAIVIAFEVCNECIDRIAHGSWMWPDTLGDAAATWFWPVALFVALNWRRSLRR